MGKAYEGDLSLSINLPEDKILHGKEAGTLRHQGLISGGPLNTLATDKTGVVACARSGGTDYAYAVFKDQAGGGRLAWVRGSFPAQGNPKQRLPVNFNGSDFYMPGMLLRIILVKFGFSLFFTRYEVNDRPPVVLYSQNGNAWYITGYAPDTTCSMRLGTPDGAPVMTGMDCIVRDDTAEYTLNRWWHNECRTFVKQKAESKVSNVVQPSVFPGIDRRMYVTGLIDADVIFRKVPGTKVRLVHIPYTREHHDFDKFIDTNVPLEELPGDRILVRGITGSLMIAWGDGESYKKVYEG
jgi:hypothetical protein